MNEPISEREVGHLLEKVDNLEKLVHELTKRVASQERFQNWFAGAAAIGAFVLGLLSDPIRHWLGRP